MEVDEFKEVKEEVKEEVQDYTKIEEPMLVTMPVSTMMVIEEHAQRTHNAELPYTVAVHYNHYEKAENEDADWLFWRTSGGAMGCVREPLSDAAAASLAQLLPSAPYVRLYARLEGSESGTASTDPFIFELLTEPARTCWGDVINSIAFAYAAGTFPLAMHVGDPAHGATGDVVTWHNGTQHTVSLWTDQMGCVATIEPCCMAATTRDVVARDAAVALPRTLTDSLLMYPCFLVPRDIEVATITAFLYKKNEFAELSEIAEPVRARSETVVLRRGVYASLAELASALNASAGLRGKRSGSIYVWTVSVKQPVLRLMAHHKQPPPSWLRIEPKGYALGLMGPVEMMLGNKKFIDCHYRPNMVMQAH
jgi:hypothetical protein